MTLPTDPQAIAERCWTEAMAWLLREAYIVRPEVSELRELYTGIANGTLDEKDREDRALQLIWKGYMSPFKDTRDVAMLQVIARGKP